MKRILFILSAVLSFVIIINSCKKKDDKDSTPTPTDTVKTIYSQTTTNNTALAIGIYTEVIKQVLTCGDSTRVHNKSTCPSTSLTPYLTYPKTLIIDFGSTGCTYNNKTFKGSITTILTSSIRTKDSIITVSFNNFMVDTIGVSGTIVMKVTNYHAKGTYLMFTDSVKNGVLTFPSGSINFSCNMDVQWYLNNPTDNTDDIILFLNFNSSGKNKDGKSFTTTIANDTLYYKTLCQEVVGGVLQLTTTSIPYPASINFGNNVACDGQATVTTKIKKQIGTKTIEEDFTYTITLP